MGRAFVRFMPCACCLSTQLVCPGCLLSPIGKRPKRQRFSSWFLWWDVVLNPRVIIGVAWSGVDRNLGLQARVVPTSHWGTSL
jgi:hypothetical protein